MAAEDYHDVPGFGGGTYIGPQSRFSREPYKCKFCQETIKFQNRKALNPNGTPHRCRADGKGSEYDSVAHQANLFALGAMNAIMSAQIKVGGVDFIHHMNFQDIADASWQAAAAMISAEKNFRNEILYAASQGD